VGTHRFTIGAGDGEGGEDRTSTTVKVYAGTYLLLVSEAGDPVGRGGTFFFGPDDGELQFIGINLLGQRRGLYVGFRGGQPGWTLRFAPSQGDLGEGLYEGAGRVTATATGRPGLDVKGIGFGSCSSLEGRFVIERLQGTLGGEIAAFRAVFEQRCEGAAGALRGEISYNVDPGAGGGHLFRRGDANADGRSSITDPIFLLRFLFGGGSPPPCPRSADADDSGGLDITDAIHLLTWLFLGGPPPEDPLAACGHDPTPDDLGCPAFAVCP
jgi:hypothetical protein